MTYDTDEDEDEAEYMADDYGPGICPACSGSGEGATEDSRCSAYKGKGEI